MSLEEEILRKLQDDGEKNQKFGNYFFMNVRPKFGNLSPVVLDERGMRPLILGNEFGDVINFCVVKVALTKSA